MLDGDGVGLAEAVIVPVPVPEPVGEKDGVFDCDAVVLADAPGEGGMVGVHVEEGVAKIEGVFERDALVLADTVGVSDAVGVGAALAVVSHSSLRLLHAAPPTQAGCTVRGVHASPAAASPGSAAPLAKEKELPRSRCQRDTPVAPPATEIVNAACGAHAAAVAPWQRSDRGCHSVPATHTVE